MPIANKKRSKIIGELTKITQSDGFLIVLSDIMQEESFMDVSSTDLISADPQEETTFNEIAFIVGLMIQNKNYMSNATTEIGAKEIIKTKKQIKKLLKELHYTYGLDRNNEDILIDSPEINIESAFYSESGAYDFQFISHIDKLYRYDREWLKQNKSFDTSIIARIFIAILTKINRSYFIASQSNTDKLDLADQTKAINLFLVSPSEVLKIVNTQEDNPISLSEINTFFSIFSYSNQGQYSTFASPSSQNIIYERPIIKTRSGYFITSTILLAKAIFSFPYYAAIKDNLYRPIFSQNIGKALEDTTREYIENVFGKNNTYESVILYQGKQRVTDIDVLAYCDSTAIIIQNKNKKLTVASKEGDMKAIQQDFQKSIQEPYEQGVRAAKILLQNQDYKLQQDNIAIKKHNITRVYILCVNGDYYPGNKHAERCQLKVQENFLPIQMSIFDLEITTDYLRNPYDFLFYLERRTTDYRNLVTNNEINYLSLYLTQDLLMPNDADFLLIGDDSEEILRKEYYINKLFFDKDICYSSSIERRLPTEYMSLLNEISHVNCDNPEKTNIIFAMRYFSSDLADDVINNIKRIKCQIEIGRPISDFTIKTNVYRNTEKIGLTCIACNNKNELLYNMAKISQKHKSEDPNVNKWIAIGFSKINNSWEISCLMVT